MKPVQILRGTKDILRSEVRLWEHTEDIARRLFDRFGFESIRTPILEEAALFRRSVGEATDIVQKEMYVFKDRSRQELALRPEGTTSIVRALIEKHLHLRLIEEVVYVFQSLGVESPFDQIVGSTATSF